MVANNFEYLSWYDAEERCSAEGAHLVSIRDDKDMNFIHSLIISSVQVQTAPPVNIFIGKYLKVLLSVKTLLNGRIQTCLSQHKMELICFSVNVLQSYIDTEH